MHNLNNTWFDKYIADNQEFIKLRQNPIAYFCAEFALSDLMPIYSGGLGVLAGDIINEAAELGLPFVAIGLLYKKGFFKQTINDAGYQEVQQQPFNPRTAGLSLVLNNEGNVFVQSIPIQQRSVFFQAWHLKVGTVDMYFLDTDVEANAPEDKNITETLYGGDYRTRILQEIILGIGGEKTLFAQGIYPSIYHMNEGHSAFAAFGIIHHAMRLNKWAYNQAYDSIRKKLIFTNHTLVPAGNDIFPREHVESCLAEYANEVEIPLNEFIEKGLTPNNQFSMTIFALNMAFKVNAVSALHAVKAKDLWPSFEMLPITNGVHIKSWMSTPLYNKLSEIMLERNITLEESVGFLSKGELWYIHQMQKEFMIKQIFNITGSIFDKDILTVTWARRLAAYKRPDLIFLHFDRIKRIIQNIQKPIQLIICGKPHPQDEEGKEILHNILENIKKINESNRVVFIPNYSISLAQFLVAGSDLWLNNPNRGFEACGTSGMKAGANGVLQLTIKDGWTDEVDWSDKGWVIDDVDSSQSLYNQLENEIVNTYYERENSLPEEWVTRMINTMNTVIQNYSTKRMLIDYFTKLYIPSLIAQE